MPADKAATKKSKPATPSKKAAPAKGENNGTLTEKEIQVLTVLSKAGDKELSRADLSAKTGINKGWSKLLGSATKTIAPHSLEGRGLIRSIKQENNRSLVYAITAAGRKALAAAKGAK